MEVKLENRPGKLHAAVMKLSDFFELLQRSGIEYISLLGADGGNGQVETRPQLPTSQGEEKKSEPPAKKPIKEAPAPKDKKPKKKLTAKEKKEEHKAYQRAWYRKHHPKKEEPAASPMPQKALPAPPAAAGGAEDEETPSYAHAYSEALGKPLFEWCKEQMKDGVKRDDMLVELRQIKGIRAFIPAESVESDLDDLLGKLGYKFRRGR
jgi:hypothetical protein